MRILLACILSLHITTALDNGSVVYICTKSEAYAYHKNKTCRTLKRCVEEGHVKSVSLEKAKNLGRRACKVCY